MANPQRRLRALGLEPMQTMDVTVNAAPRIHIQ
jgi:hypothetical protein